MSWALERWSDMAGLRMAMEMGGSPMSRRGSACTEHPHRVTGFGHY